MQIIDVRKEYFKPHHCVKKDYFRQISAMKKRDYNGALKYSYDHNQTFTKESNFSIK